MRYSVKDLLVGVVFLAGFFLIAIFTIVVQNITWLEAGNTKQLCVLFDRVSGLEVGHKALASGMEVGQVRKMDMQDDGKVKVTIDLVKDIKLYPGYQIAVKDASALGGKFVDIQVGDPASAEGPLPAEIPLTQLHEGKAQPSLFDDPNLRETFMSLKNITHEVEITLKDKEKRGTIALLLTERELYDNLLDSSENLREISEQVQTTEGTVGKLLYDRQLADDIAQAVENIRYLTDDLKVIAGDVKVITSDLRAGRGTVGKLLVDDTLYDETEQVMVNLAEITDKIKNGEGTMGKLLVKEDVYEELVLALSDARTMMQNINKTVEAIDNGEGTIATLIHDKEMAKNLKDTLAHLKVVTKRLEKGEGTVGKLLADETLYNELQKVIKNFSDSLEDTREQVPITTFTTVLFKAF